MHKKNTYLFFFPCLFMSVVPAEAKENALVIPDNYYWNGLNPFFQPARTLNYYGSGDVDNSCKIDPKDLDSLNSLVSLKATCNYRADCNGDGKISNEDATLLKEYLQSDKTLPSHWNELTTKEQRIYWLNRCLALDITSQIPYSNGFVCMHFSCQFSLNFSYFGGNLAHTMYRNGGTIFNLPVYSVTLFDHSINAILIGDDPSEFNDWYFIEPQTDGIVDPVDTGEGIDIEIMTFLLNNALYSNKILTATRTKAGWTITKTASGFLTARPQTPETVDYIDMMPSWNPRIVQMDNSDPMILFERLNDQLPPRLSIFSAPISKDVLSGETVLISDTMSPRLLDVKRSATGNIHFLWRGTKDFNPALFIGAIDPLKKTMKNVTTFTGPPLPKAGSLIPLSDDSLHVFWTTDQSESGDSTLVRGINRSIIGNGLWSLSQNVEAFSEMFVPVSWTQRSPINYVMCALRFNGGPAVLFARSHVHLMLPAADGWNNYQSYDESVVSGARAVIDGKNIVHCIYWRETGQLPAGKVLYQFFKDSAWSKPVNLDSSDNNRCPDIAVNDRNDLLTVWEKDVSGGATAYCTRVYSNGVWQPATTHFAPENESVWYPRVTALRDTNYIVSWESQGLYKIQVRFKQLAYSPVITMIASENTLLEPSKKFRIRMHGGMLFAGIDHDAEMPGAMFLYNLQGRILYQTQFPDVRRCAIDLRPFGRGFRVVALSSAGVRYRAKINVCD